MTTTRVKFCGLTRAVDVDAAVEIGANAVGFVCYPASRRFVALETLGQLTRRLPPFVTPVLLFVNDTEETIRRAIDVVPNAVLQFHGDETAAQCAHWARPYLRAVRMSEGVDLLDCEREYASAIGLLADAPAEGYGGGGRNFDWARLPQAGVRTKPLVLAGGLTDSNVGRAVTTVRPFAVDVSSGIEDAPGIKSSEKMRRFLAAVRAADRALETR
jgi:phosphoribosylanthranilate isomerase